MALGKDPSIALVRNILQGRPVEELSKKFKPSGVKSSAPHLPRQTELSKNAQKRRIAALEESGCKLNHFSGKKAIDDPEIFKGNIENYIGLTQVPTGVIGPLRVNGLYASGDFFVPFATTEGALVASYNRGAKIISQSGGASVACLSEKVSRAPGFVFHNLSEAGEFIVWCVDHFEKMQEIAGTTTRHGKLKNMSTTLCGNQVILNFEYTTGDAAGQNMVTIATEAACQYILSQSPIKPRFYFIESNLSGDKKATAFSYLSVRGKKVTAEVTIPRKIVEKYLRTSPEMMMEYGKVSFLGGVQSGSMGVQGHFANALAAIFLSCGQDVACVSEASIGITRFDITEQGDFYASVTLPNLIVGTVGGGTRLPTQNEALSMMECTGAGTAKKFAEICTASVLAGEISITGAITAGYFASAHKVYGRK